MEIALMDDVNKYQLLVKQKKMKLPKGVSDLAIMQRLYGLVAYKDLGDTIKKHSEYEDKFGNRASSAGGFMIQINKKIKQLFNKSVQDLVAEEDLEKLTIIRSRVAKKIVELERLKKLRSEIKREVYILIETIFHVLS